jgi:hypothetical protein
MIVASVTGLFREIDPAGDKRVRSFHRVFSIVPLGGGGYCITNEELFVASVKDNQRVVSICFNKNL